MKELIKPLSLFLGEDIIEITLSNSGYLSQGYIIESKDKKYFVRTIKNLVPGYEYVGENFKGLAISDLMTKNSEELKSYGVCKVNDSYFHIIDYIEGSNVMENINMSHSELEIIAEKIGLLHLNGKNKVTYFNEQHKSGLYKRSFREIITNNETLFSLYENNILENSNEIDFFNVLIEKMLKEYFIYIQNIDVSRLTTLHGDFWNGNILKKSDGNITFIDFSRIPYGEPGIDIGRFLAQLDVDLIVSGHDTFQTEAKRVFLSKYKEITGDNLIDKYLRLSTLWVVFIKLSPLVQNFLKRDNNTIDKIKNWVINY